MKVKLTKLFSILFFSSSSTLLVLVPNSISAQSCTPTSKPYSLIDLVGASKSGTTITKTSETSWMNAGGTTNIKLSEGDYITYKVAESKSVAVGLSASKTDNNITTIENCLYTRFDNKIYIYQNNIQKLSGVSYNVNSVFKILVEGGKVKYYVNGNLLYQNTTSLTTSQVVVDFAMYDKESQIKELQVYKCCINSDADGDGVCDSDDQYPGQNDLADVNQNGIPDLEEITTNYIENTYDLRAGYTGITSTGTGTAKTITKNVATAWGNAGGSTNFKISNGQYIQYRVKNNMNVMVGFSKTLRTTTDFGSIENSLYTRFDNYVYAYQGAVNRSGVIKTYTESSVFKIMFLCGRVKFYCDDHLIYIAATVYSINEDLYVDFSLNSNNSQIVDLQFFSNCPNNTITLNSATSTNIQSVCANIAITNITYATTGATNATFSGLPTGISGSFASNTITISGTPTVVAGTYPYTINLTGGCGTVSASGTITVNSTVEATFEQVGIIGNAAITYQLPATSSNGITGTWNPSTLVEGEQDYTFTPTTGQCSSPVTMPFMVLKPRMITAYDDDFTVTAINGNTGGETPSVFDNDGINFSEAVTSTYATVTILGVTPSTVSFTIDTDGIITIPSNTPDGTYSVDYQITSIACSLNQDSATAIIEVNSPSSARKAKPTSKGLDKILVYPNPSTAIFNFDLTYAKEEYNSVSIYNVLGQTIYQGNLTPKSSNPINLSNAPSGYYIAKVSGNNESISFQLIKQ